MTFKQKKRELAERNIRIYSSTLELLQEASLQEGKTIARIISELVDHAYSK